MRNLKRALSLALASVMLLGMMVVGTSAASYPDVKDSDNVEAIEVLNAVGVMIGKKGKFDPDAPVNRHEMAAIMARLYLGKDAAENYVGSHPFTDVYPWADKYVAACYENGLINGTSRTTYSGNQPLTAVQAAAMMLRALGYEKLSQNADDWRVPVTAKANEIRLFKDVVSSPSAQLTRNQVAQLALNTLKADVVTTTSGSNINLGDIGTITTDVKYEKVDNSKSDDYRVVSADQDEVQQLCEKLYGKDLKLDSNDNDDVGRPASTWSYKGVGEIITIANEADYTVVLKEAPDDLNDLCDQAKKNMDKKTGFAVASDIKLNGGAISAVDADLGAGDVAEFYMNDDNELEAVYVTRYVLDQITAIDDDVDDDDADEGVVCYVDFDDAGTAINNTDVPGFNASTYVEDAYVALLINDDGDIVDSYIPEDIEDSIDTNKNDTEFTIGSTKYTVAAGYATPGDCVAANTVAPGTDNTYTLYLDSNGYILGIVEVEGEATSINDVYYLDTVWSVPGMSNTYHAQLVALDGTVSEVQLETKDHEITGTPSDEANDLSQTAATKPYNGGYDSLNGLLVTISDKKTGDSKSNNNKYNLKVWAPTEDWDADKITTGNLGELEKDLRSVTNNGTTYRLNASTVYLFVEKSASDLDVSRYVGGVAYDSTAANALKANKSYVITEKDKTVAKYIVIATEDAGQSAEYSSDVIFIKSASSTKGDGFRSQTVYLPNGREETWKIDEDEYSGSTLSGAPGFFTYAEGDDAIYTLDNPTAIDTANATGSAVTKDWQDDKDEGVLGPVVIDDKDDLFEDLLTVTYGSSTSAVTFQDISVANASFKDLHDKDGAGQYNRTVTSLNALVKLIEDTKADAATLYLNVSEDGAVTIFVTAVTAHVGSFSAGTKQENQTISVGGTGKTTVDWTSSTDGTTVALNGKTLSVTLDTDITYTVTFETDYSGDGNDKVAVDATGTGGFAAVLTAAKTALQNQINAANTAAAAGTSDYTKYENLKLTGANLNVTGTVDKTPQTYA